MINFNGNFLKIIILKQCIAYFIKKLRIQQNQNLKTKNQNQKLKIKNQNLKLKSKNQKLKPETNGNNHHLNLKSHLAEFVDVNNI